VEGLNIIYGPANRPTALRENAYPPGIASSKNGPIVSLMLNQAETNPHEPGRHCGIGFTPQIRVERATMHGGIEFAPLAGCSAHGHRERR
jgi:hypothetical protein